jgi:predicted Zn-dependent peptidase
MSHFLEHLLFKGSESRSALEIANAIDCAGGDMNAFTTKECTAFYVRVLREDFEMAMDILFEIMCAPAFDPEEFEAERQVILEEILVHNDEPADVAQERFSSVLFGNHGLGKDVLGTEATINAMTPDGVRSFFEKHYRTPNVVFAASGAVTHDEVIEGANKRWKQRSNGVRPTRHAPVPEQASREAIHRVTDQVHLVRGVAGPGRHNYDRYAVSVLDTIFGSGVSSRLFQEVREKRGLAYTVFSGFVPYEDSGEFSVYLGSSPERINEAEEVLAVETDRIATSGVSADEVERAKRNLRANMLLGLEDTLSRMSRNGRSMLFHGEVLPIDEIASRVDSVSVDDVNRVATELLSKTPVSVRVGPEVR